MDEILNLSINEMPQTEFDCSCGKHHNFSVHDMSIRKGAIEDLPKMAEPFKDGKILVVFDNHTYEVAGKRAVELLKENGFNVKELLFDTGDDILIPDEKTLGRIVQEQYLDTSLMVAVGSGVINDSVKFVTSRSGLPYIIVATTISSMMSLSTSNIYPSMKLNSSTSSMPSDSVLGLTLRSIVIWNVFSTSSKHRSHGIINRIVVSPVT